MHGYKFRLILRKKKVFVAFIDGNSKNSGENCKYNNFWLIIDQAI